jgi:hypothetical protein
MPMYACALYSTVELHPIAWPRSHAVEVPRTPAVYVLHVPPGVPDGVLRVLLVTLSTYLPDTER